MNGDGNTCVDGLDQVFSLSAKIYWAGRLRYLESAI